MTRPAARLCPTQSHPWAKRAAGAALCVAAVVGAWCAAAPLAAAASPARPNAAPPATGYWQAAADGSVFPFGNAPFLGSMGAVRLNKPVVGMAATPDGQGYWLVAADGGVFSFGDAPFLGSMGAVRLNKPVVGMAATPDGQGYWLVAADGGVFSFGDASFLGSTGSRRLAKPVVGMAATPDGTGYWLVAADGGVFSFGSARYHGSLPGLGQHTQRVVSLLASQDGGGYLLVGPAGSSWSFGDALRVPSLTSLGVHVGDIVGAALTPDRAGFWDVGSDGGVFSFGDAPFLGSLPAPSPGTDIVALVGAGSGAPSTSPAGGSNWSTPQPFDPAATGASTVSCATDVFSAAVDGTSQVWTWTGTWSAPTAVPGVQLSGVSCASATFCVATGMRSAGATAQTAALVYDGGTWAPAPSFTPVDTVGGLVAVSCPSRSSCTAVGDGDVGGAATPLVESFDGSTWSVSSPPTPAVASSGGYSLVAVSCPDATTCAAVGSYSNGPDGFSFVETEQGSTWSLASTPGLQADFTLSSVSCASDTVCMAVGTAAFPHTPEPSTALVDSYDGSSWTATTAAPSVPLWPVSCTGASHCVAGSRAGAVTTFEDGVWSTPQDVDGTAIITSISCTATGFCMASDNAGDALTSQTD